MKSANIQTSAAKLELALKTFRTTWAIVEPQWTDAARRDFQETYLTPIEPNVKNMLDSINRLAAALAVAESHCGSEGSTE